MIYGVTLLHINFEGFAAISATEVYYRVWK